MIPTPKVRSALEESETRAAELVSHSIYGIFRPTIDGSFLSTNPALLRLLACSSFEELQSLNLVSDVFRYFQEFSPLLSSCREHGLVHNAELEWRRKDGGLVFVRLHLRYLSLPGPADAIEGVVEDITEVRLLERQLQQAQKFESRLPLRAVRRRFSWRKITIPSAKWSANPS